MGLKVKELQAAKSGEWLSDGPAGSGRGAGVLLFRRTSSGAIVAYFRYTLPDGRRDSLPIGQYDESGRHGLTLAAARSKAGELSMVYQSGIRDIREHLQSEEEARQVAAQSEREDRQQAQQRAEERARHTLRALCDAYVALLERGGKRSSASAARSVFKCHVFPHEDVADRPARDLNARQIATVIRQVRERGNERTAGLLRSYLGAAYSVAKRSPFDAKLPSELVGFEIEHNPVTDIPAIPVRTRARTLSAHELRAYLGHLRRVGRSDLLGPENVDYALIVALFAGGQRIAQLLRARVKDFDPETSTLSLLDGKGRRATAREHLLPLGPRASSIVVHLAERAVKRELIRAKTEARQPDTANCPIFSSDGRVALAETTVSKRITEISDCIGGEPFDVRDVRRTVETMMAAMRVSADYRAQVLSHGISGVQAKHYDRHDYFDEKQAVLAVWEARLSAIESGSKIEAGTQFGRRERSFRADQFLEILS